MTTKSWRLRCDYVTLELHSLSYITEYRKEIHPIHRALKFLLMQTNKGRKCPLRGDWARQVQVQPETRAQTDTHSRRGQQKRRVTMPLQIALTLVAASMVQRVCGHSGRDCVVCVCRAVSPVKFCRAVTPQQQLLPLGTCLSSSFPREKVSKDNFRGSIQFGVFATSLKCLCLGNWRVSKAFYMSHRFVFPNKRWYLSSVWVSKHRRLEWWRLEFEFWMAPYFVLAL